MDEGGARAALEPLLQVDHSNLVRYAEAALAGHPPEGVTWRRPCWYFPDR